MRRAASCSTAELPLPLPAMEAEARVGEGGGEGSSRCASLDAEGAPLKGGGVCGSVGEKIAIGMGGVEVISRTGRLASAMRGFEGSLCAPIQDWVTHSGVRYALAIERP